MTSGFLLKIILSAFLLISLRSSICASDSKSQKPLFSFGILADAQYCNAPDKGARKYRKSIQKLKNCVDLFNSEDLSFVIQLGDLIDRDYSSFEAILPLLEKLKAPVYNVLGNHDFEVDGTDKKKVAGKLKLRNGYYDFCIKNFRFIVLNGNEFSLLAHPEGSEKYKESKSVMQRLKKEGSVSACKWNGGMSEKQISWLEEKLKEAEKKKEKVIIFSHYPIYPSSEVSLWNDWEVLKLIEQFPNIIAYMNGHHHKGHFALRKGIYHVNFKGMVEFDKPTFAIADVYEDRISIRGFGAEDDRVLNFTYIVPAKERISKKDKIFLKTKIPGAKIYYTLDGSSPGKKSRLYEMPFSLDEDTTVRYATCTPDGKICMLGQKKNHHSRRKNSRHYFTLFFPQC